jgi:hypothetical protein
LQARLAGKFLPKADDGLARGGKFIRLAARGMECASASRALSNTVSLIFVSVLTCVGRDGDITGVGSPLRAVRPRDLMEQLAPRHQS